MLEALLASSMLAMGWLHRRWENYPQWCSKTFPHHYVPEASNAVGPLTLGLKMKWDLSQKHCITQIPILRPIFAPVVNALPSLKTPSLYDFSMLNGWQLSPQSQLYTQTMRHHSVTQRNTTEPHWQRLGNVNKRHALSRLLFETGGPRH